MSYRTLLLQVTKKCNLRCPNCIWVLKSDEFFDGTEMKLQDAKHIIDHYISVGVNRISIQAEGEVLLYPHYKELVQYCKEKGRPVSTLITNGVLLDKFTEFVFLYIPHVLVSIDGPFCGEYIKVRGGTEANFNRIINAVGNFVKEKRRRNLGNSISINCVLAKDNLHIMHDMIDLADRLGVDKLRFRNFHPLFGGNGRIPLYASDSDAAQAATQAATYAASRNVNIVLPVLYQEGGVRFGCDGMLKNTIVIGADGSFAPCCHLEADGTYGNFFANPRGYTDNIKKKAFIKTLYNASSYDAIPESCKDCPRLQKGFDK